METGIVSIRFDELDAVFIVSVLMMNGVALIARHMDLGTALGQLSGAAAAHCAAQ